MSRRRLGKFFRWADLAVAYVFLKPLICMAGPWHADVEAGVRVRVPWEDAVVKNASQVENLILHDEKTVIPRGHRYTSAVYAPAGLPFFVVWVRPDLTLPTRRDLRTLAKQGQAMGLTKIRFSPATLRGSGQIEALPGKALQARVLFQITKGATVFLGYFFEKPEHAADFEQIRSSFDITPDKRLAWENLPHGGWSLSDVLLATVGVLGATLIVTFVWALQRKPRPLPTELAPTEALTPEPGMTSVADGRVPTTSIGN